VVGAFSGSGAGTAASRRSARAVPACSGGSSCGIQPPPVSWGSA